MHDCIPTVSICRHKNFIHENSYEYSNFFQVCLYSVKLLDTTGAFSKSLSVVN